MSTRKLLSLVAGLAALLACAGVATAAFGGSDRKPERIGLAPAIQRALAAEPVEGVSARIEFTNRLLPAGALPRGSAMPLLAGASGRLWWSRDGRLRLELQSQGGDAQIVVGEDALTVYDAGTETVYRLPLPAAAREERPGAPDASAGAVPSLADVERALDRLGEAWAIVGPEPVNVAGRPSYSVRVSPRGSGGLLGAATLAWDAANGAPLRAALYADGEADPVLELRVTEVDFGAIDADDLDPEPPADARVVELAPRADGAPHGGTGAHGHGDRGGVVRGVRAVQARLPFELAAPSTLAGLPRRDAWLAGSEQEPVAIVTYGEGLGAIVVAQAQGDRDPLAGPGGGGDDEDPHGLSLPRVNVDGATGSELATALGTVLTFRRDGVVHVVAGSVPAQAAETAARELR